MIISPYAIWIGCLFAILDHTDPYFMRSSSLDEIELMHRVCLNLVDWAERNGMLKDFDGLFNEAVGKLDEAADKYERPVRVAGIGSKGGRAIKISATAARLAIRERVGSASVLRRWQELDALLKLFREGEAS